MRDCGSRDSGSNPDGGTANLFGTELEIEVRFLMGAHSKNRYFIYEVSIFEYKIELFTIIIYPLSVLP